MADLIQGRNFESNEDEERRDMAKKLSVDEMAVHAERAATKACPRDWRNDPAWLRALLRRTWERLGGDLSTVFDMEADEQRAEVDALNAQVLFVLTEPGDFGEAGQ